MTVRQISYRLKADGKAELQRDAQAVGDALEDAGRRGDAAFVAAGRSMQHTSELSDRQVAKYKALAQAAREAERAEQAQARFNSALGVGGGTGLRPSDFLGADEVGGGVLTRGQRAGRLNLVRQGADVFTTASMGMSPGMIAIQQGPQILDALAQAGLKATPAMIALGAGITAVGVAVIAAAAAQNAYEKSMIGLDVAARGLGASAGMTADQINAQAMAAADASDISNRSARSMAADYAATGRIGQTVLGDLVAITGSYAATTRQDAASATKELASAFSDPAKGAADLNQKLNFLSVAQEQHIENLAKSGREAEAQAELVRALRGAMIDASDTTTGWAHAFQGLSTEAGNAFDAVGRYIDRLVTGGSKAEQLTRARQGLAQANTMLGLDPTNIVAQNNKRQFQAEIDALYKDFVAETNRLRDAGINQRDRDRQVIADRYVDPKVKSLRDKQAERANYLSKGGKEGDDTIKKIDADIQALKAGYSSAADMAAKLKSEHERAIREGQKATREREAEARKAARDTEEAIRLEGARADHVLDNQRRVAQAANDDSTLDLLARQGRLQEEINRWVREGLSVEQARVNARAQIAAEMQAESDALRKSLSNPEGFVSSQDRMATALSGATIKPYSALDDYAEQLRISTGQAFNDGLVSGIMNGNFWDAFTSRLKYAAATGLADSLTSSLFGKRDGTGKAGALVSLASKLIPGFAVGTNSAPGGLSLVGEYGPEIVELPQGAKVKTSSATQAMLHGLGARAANVGTGEVVNFHYSPTYHLQGTAEEIRALRGEMAQDRANFRANAIQAYADAKARRVIQ
ncbi:phage tail length tape measure family protein [Caulobacter vibrioides]|uniref:phage tail length tape measure family protein n=1 Tax=Caulobacter vibrioides TaxID=155892 RepID=UPI000BB50922|nr:phage tail length tape measure family protein [Caulobacter vibrioides]ATC25212.1 hypothetical protein CA608_12070 [Caulobacter vibrioides]PLR13982.1 hypothetical protein CVUC_05370 [Caulobacter vibrioides]